MSVLVVPNSFAPWPFHDMSERHFAFSKII